MGAGGDVCSLCVSQADDCRLLGQLPKVKCLRNGRREGKSCLPTAHGETQALGGVRGMEPGETSSMQWSTRRSVAPGNKGGP